MTFSAIIQSFRLRTLPLASACICMAAILAAHYQCFSIKIFVLSLLTTILLQILSNLANDYGDSQNGADNDLRQGPQRAVHSGLISKSEMKLLIYCFITASLVSGIALLWVSFGLFSMSFLLFLILGFACIAGAYYYTAGQKPYGYAGLGDISVFVFFGIVGVVGGYFLYSKNINFYIFLPAISVGFLSVAVLNLNNMRDIDADFFAKKLTIPVRIGYIGAKYYHFLLILLAFISAILFHLMVIGFGKTMFFILAFILLGIDLKYLLSTKKGDKIDHLLKKTALFTLFFVILFGLSILS